MCRFNPLEAELSIQSSGNVFVSNITENGRMDFHETQELDCFIPD